jgi:hypothetical protein
VDADVGSRSLVVKLNHFVVLPVDLRRRDFNGFRQDCNQMIKSILRLNAAESERSPCVCLERGKMMAVQSERLGQETITVLSCSELGRCF